MASQAVVDRDVAAAVLGKEGHSAFKKTIQRLEDG
jgi:hypothetical protein